MQMIQCCTLVLPLLKELIETYKPICRCWCSRNRLTVNAHKTKSMVFGTKRFISQRKLPSLFISDEEIKYTDQYMNHVYQLASHKIYLLSKIRQYVNANAALSIYKTKILPYFDLGDIFYLGSHQKSTVKLQRLQNRALQVCIGAAPRTSTNALHVLAQVPLLEHRRLSHLRN